MLASLPIPLVQSFMHSSNAYSSSAEQESLGAGNTSMNKIESPFKGADHKGGCKSIGTPPLKLLQVLGEPRHSGIQEARDHGKARKVSENASSSSWLMH